MSAAKTTNAILIEMRDRTGLHSNAASYEPELVQQLASELLEARRRPLPLTVTLHEQDGWWTAICPELLVSGMGSSLPRAMEAAGCSIESTLRVMSAAKRADWMQVVGNGGPPCFHLEDERFCLRAERWPGHKTICGSGAIHEYVSLESLLRWLGKLLNEQ